MPDASGYAKTETHDLTTPRGRLLYLRDVVVPSIPIEQLSMEETDCGTKACLAGWAVRDLKFRDACGLEANQAHRLFCNFGADIYEDRNALGITESQSDYLFMPVFYDDDSPSHAELTAHVNDVLEGRVK